MTMYHTKTLSEVNYLAENSIFDGGLDDVFCGPLRGISNKHQLFHGMTREFGYPLRSRMSILNINVIGSIHKPLYSEYTFMTCVYRSIADLRFKLFLLNDPFVST